MEEIPIWYEKNIDWLRSIEKHKKKSMKRKWDIIKKTIKITNTVEKIELDICSVRHAGIHWRCTDHIQNYVFTIV